MTEDQFPYSAFEPPISDGDSPPPKESTIQEAVIILHNDELDSQTENQSKDLQSQNQSPRSNFTLGSLNIRQLDQELNQDGQQDTVAQNTDWFTLARKLRNHNRELVKTVVQLEQALANTQETVQNQIMQSKNNDLLIHQQAEELNNTQKQVSRLFYELEASHQTAQRQQNLLDKLTEQLQISQQQSTQLETECALLQESYNEQSHQLITAQKEIQELRERLFGQPRQVLEQNLNQNLNQNLEQSLEQNLEQNLEQSLEQSLEQNVQSNPPVKQVLGEEKVLNFPIQSSLNSEILASLNYPELDRNLTQELEHNLTQELEQNLIEKLDRNLEENLEENLQLKEEIIREKPLVYGGENEQKNPPQVPTISPHHHRPIQPWSSQTKDLPLPLNLTLNLPKSFGWSEDQELDQETINKSEIREITTEIQAEKKIELELSPPENNILQTPAQISSKKEKSEGIIITFPFQKNQNESSQKFPSFNIKPSSIPIQNREEILPKSEVKLTDKEREISIAINQEKMDQLSEQLSEQSFISETVKNEVNLEEKTTNIPQTDQINTPAVTSLKSKTIPSSKQSKSHILLPLELPKINVNASPFMKKITLSEVTNEDEIVSELPINLSETEVKSPRLTPLWEQEKVTKNSPSPLIHPRRSQKTKKASRSINLPNFSSYHSF